jgi:hypothetical protein
MFPFARVRILLAAAFVLGIALPAHVRAVLAEWQSSAGKNKLDLVTREAGRYEALISSLPVRGFVGYLPQDDSASVDAERRFFLAEYTLTPRVVVMGTGPEFVVVVPEASAKGGESHGAASSDARLADFVLFERFDNGLRIFRRVR